MKPAPQEPEGPPAAPYIGSGLVVQDGPGAGAFHPFHAPVTLIGRSGGCDIRLESPQVRPLHCLLTPGAEGVALRALAQDGVLVNGRATSTAHLHDGDLLAVGPVRFRVRMPVASADQDDPVFESLRIQSLAVAAQQSALTEQEIQLCDRAEALARQEGQLAARLEEQQKQLLDLHAQIGQARDKLRAKRQEFASLSEAQEKELADVRAALDDRRRRIERRESRLLGIVKRMKAGLRRRQRRNDERREEATHEIERRNNELEADKAAFDQFRRRFHTQAELDRRQLTEANAKLAAAEHSLAAREFAICAERKELTRARKTLASERRQLADERAREACRRDALRREIQHLEARAVHARQWLEQQQPTPRLIESPPIELPPACDREKALGRIAAELADQRLALAEQMQRFCQAQSHWEQDRSAVLADLDALASMQTERDRALNLRELELGEAENQLDEERAALMRLVARVEADRARAAAEIGAWRLELDRQRVRIEAKDREIAYREANLKELYLLWGRRRTAEVEAWRSARAEQLRARNDWAGLRDNWLRARARLAAERQELAAKQMAVEQLRQECLEFADRPQTASRRLERLRRHWQTRLQSDARDLQRLRAELASECAQLDSQLRELTRRETSLASRHHDVVELLSDAERQFTDAAAQRLRLAVHEQAYLEERDLLETRVIGLQEQIEGLARVLIDEPRKTGRAA